MQCDSLVLYITWVSLVPPCSYIIFIEKRNLLSSWRQNHPVIGDRSHSQHILYMYNTYWNWARGQCRVIVTPATLRTFTWLDFCFRTSHSGITWDKPYNGVNHRYLHDKLKLLMISCPWMQVPLLIYCLVSKLVVKLITDYILWPIYSRSLWVSLRKVAPFCLFAYWVISSHGIPYQDLWFWV